MRVLVINYEYPPIGGGGGIVTRDIVERFAELGHEVTVLTSRYAGLREREHINGVEILRVPVLMREKMEVATTASMLSYFPSSVLKGMLSLNKRTYDIINTHFAIPSGPTGYVLAKKFCVPNVLSIHGGDLYDPSKSLSPHRIKLLSATVRAVMNAAARVVAQSNDTKEKARVHYNVKREIDVIPLGIKKPSFQQKQRSDYGIDRDDTVFCTVGRLIPRKNITDALRVLAERKDSFSFKFLIVGEGPERTNIEQKVRELGLTENVFMYGNVTDEEKYQLLHVSDIYISTAGHEGFGLVFLEAMASGLPVISYDYGGHTDFLEDGRTGFLVRLNDRETFGRQIDELRENRQLAGEMGGFNKQLVQNYYIENCADRYIALFDRVISSWGSQEYCGLRE